MKRLSVRQVYDVFVVLFFLITIFLVNLAEAKSLKKGEVYRSLDGRVTMEVISKSELEITQRGTTFVAEYGFKGDKLRVVTNVRGMKHVYYLIILITPEGLMEETTREIYYSKTALAVALERQRAEEKRRAEEKKREELKKTTYTDNGNGTVTQGTGLMWQKEDDNTEKKGEDAISYCEGLSLGGYSDWRLPTIEELKSIIDRTREKPAINTTYFPNTKSSGYWSSTTGAGGWSAVRFVSFYDGFVYGSNFNSGTYYVRCVRGGQ